MGLPLAVSLVEAGEEVVGFDINPSLIAGLRDGKSTTGDVTSQRLNDVLASGLTVTSSAEGLGECNTFIICVPTPLSMDRKVDTSAIEAAVSFIAPHLRNGSLVVLESTSYPGTTEEVVAHPLAAATGLIPGSDFCVGFSPERIDPGNDVYEVSNTPKVISGLEPCCLERIRDVYSKVSTTVVEAAGVREAEFAKLLENTYRHINIALVNEMAKFTRGLGVDLREAIRLASTKPFGFEPFYPGPGVGGHCIPIDPHYLASRVESELGESFRFVQLATDINRGMPHFVVIRLEEEMASLGLDLNGSSVLLLGVAYKRNIGDMRETPAEDIARLLRQREASVSFHDPYVPDWEVDGHPVEKVTLDGLGGSTFDAIVLVTDHSAFQGQDFDAFAKVCLDTRGVLTGSRVVSL